jgi:serine/threonine protein kinase
MACDFSSGVMAYNNCAEAPWLLLFARLHLHASLLGFVDLLDRCLRWDPAERLTPAEAMTHPWMQEQLVKQPLASSTYR